MPTLTRRGRVTHPSKGVPPWDGHRTPSPPWAAPFRGVPSDGAHGGCTHAPPACRSSPGVANPRAPIRGHRACAERVRPGFSRACLRFAPSYEGATAGSVGERECHPPLSLSTSSLAPPYGGATGLLVGPRRFSAGHLGPLRYSPPLLPPFRGGSPRGVCRPSGRPPSAPLCAAAAGAHLFLGAPPLRAGTASCGPAAVGRRCCGRAAAAGARLCCCPAAVGRPCRPSCGAAVGGRRCLCPAAAGRRCRCGCAAAVGGPLPPRRAATKGGRSCCRRAPLCGRAISGRTRRRCGRAPVSLLQGRPSGRPLCRLRETTPLWGWMTYRRVTVGQPLMGSTPTGAYRSSLWTRIGTTPPRARASGRCCHRQGRQLWEGLMTLSRHSASTSCACAPPWG